MILLSFIMLAFQESRWWDYPGFELWKFANLTIFVLALVYIMTRKVKLGEIDPREPDTSNVTDHTNDFCIRRRSIRCLQPLAYRIFAGP